MRILGRLADMLDNGSTLGGDESGAYEGIEERMRAILALA